MTLTKAFLAMWLCAALGCGYRSSTLLDERGSDGGPDARPSGDAAASSDGSWRDAGPFHGGSEDTRLLAELGCRLDHDQALAAAARATACHPDGRGSMRSYFEAWEAGLLASALPWAAGLAGFDLDFGCDAWRCIATATSCDAFGVCLAATVRDGPCSGEIRCNGSVLSRCNWDGSGFIDVFECGAFGATCDPERGCVLDETCSFGVDVYDLACLDGDVVLCGGRIRSRCDAWYEGSSCASFAISGEVPTVWCSPTGMNGYGAYAESRVECAGGVVTFTSATSVRASFDCLGAGYSGCNDRGCVP